MKVRQCRLELLDIGPQDITEVPPPLLSSAVIRLSQFAASHVSLAQAEAVLLRLAEMETSCLRDLTLKVAVRHSPGGSVYNIEPETAAAALVKLEKTGGINQHLSADQLQSLLSRMTQEDEMGFKMKELNLSQTKISSLSPGLVAAALVRVEEVTTGGSLSLEQAGDMSRLCSHWSSSFIPDLHSDEIFNVATPALLCHKDTSQGTQTLLPGSFAVSLWHKNGLLPCRERIS